MDGVAEARTAGASGSMPELSRAQRLRSELRVIIISWVFGAVWMWTVTGATMTRFAKALGTPEWAFGVIAALPFVGTLFQLPAAYLADRVGYRKLLFLIFATTHRLLWFVIAAIPWVVPESGGWWWKTMLAVLLMNWACGSMGGLLWTSWMADVIPRKVRGRYFAVRNRIGQGMGLLTTLGVGYVLDLGERAAGGGDSQGIMLRLTSALLAAAAVLGVMDVLQFVRVRDDYPRAAPAARNGLSSFLEPLRDSNFRWYLAFNFTFHLAIGFVGQYVWLYAFDVVGMSNKQANLLIVAVPLLLMMGSYPMWGRLMDRLGRKPVLIGAGILVACGSVGWILVGPDAAHDIDWSQLGSVEGAWRVLGQLAGLEWSWWSRVGYFLVLLTTFAWPGVEVANFNIILDMASPRPGGRRGGGAYVAINSLAIAAGGILSGLVAGSVAGWLAERFSAQNPIRVPGTPVILTYHGLLFLGSSVLRAASLFLMAKVHEPEAVGTRAALQFMGETLYSNIRETFTIPMRVMGQAYRWTFLISLPIRRQIRFGGRVVRRRWWQLFGRNGSAG